MFSKIKSLFTVADLRNKVLFTLFIFAVYRIGVSLRAPGVDAQAISQLREASESQGALGFLNLFSGGAFGSFSIFALGVMPYITASIIMQVLTVVIPKLEQWQQEGATGQRKITQWTRYVAVAIATLQAAGLTFIFGQGNGSAFFGAAATVPDVVLLDPFMPRALLVIPSLVAGTVMIMWLGELISQRGIGNGMSMMIFASIVSDLPYGYYSLLQSRKTFVFVVLVGVTLLILAAVVRVELGQRRIPVQFAKRVVGRRQFGGQSTYIPIKVNMAGVVPVIFASSLLYLPALIAQFNQPDAQGQVAPWVTWVSTYLTQGDHPLYMALYFLLILGFTYFYVAITFNPEEVSDNMKQYGGFIPGIRAGRPTTEFLEYVLSRITFPGAIYLGLIALIPLVAFSLIGANQNFPFGGTSILIIVGVGLDTVKQINAQMQQRNYEGLLK